MLGGTMSGEGPSQADTRAWSEFIDQHGRVWGAITENKTRHPCAPLQPQFDAPYIPFQKYLRVVSANKIEIEYRAALKDMDESDRLYDTDLRNHAQALYGDKALEAIEHPSPQLLALAGERPQRVPRDFPEAALSDNQWVLGLTAAVPNWALPLLKKEEEKKASAPMKAYPDAGEAEEEEKVEPYTLKKVAFGRWKMPDGTTVGGTEEEAMQKLEERFPDEYAALLVEA